jgi:hypothetical protein
LIPRLHKTIPEGWTSFSISSTISVLYPDTTFTLNSIVDSYRQTRNRGSIDKWKHSNYDESTNMHLHTGIYVKVLSAGTFLNCLQGMQCLHSHNNLYFLWWFGDQWLIHIKHSKMWLEQQKLRVNVLVFSDSDELCIAWRSQRYICTQILL